MKVPCILFNLGHPARPSHAAYMLKDFQSAYHNVTRGEITIHMTHGRTDILKVDFPGVGITFAELEEWDSLADRNLKG